MAHLGIVGARKRDGTSTAIERRRHAHAETSGPISTGRLLSYQESFNDLNLGAERTELLGWRSPEAP